MNTPEALRVSVVIAAYKGARTIGQQLDALARQVDAPPFEVIVVDNNSPDDLRAVCSRFASRLDLRVVSAARHQGQGYARNVGALAARGEILCLCDQDDVVSSTWVAGLASAVEAGGVLATGPMDFVTLNPPVTALVGRDLGDVTPFVAHGYLPFVFGSNVGIRLDDFKAIGGMDNAFQGGDEDVDFSWRAQEYGLRIVVEPRAVVHYRVRTTPKAVFRQQLGYGRTPVLSYVRGREAGRPVNGMSLRWTLASVAGLPREWLAARRDPRTLLGFAQDAGRKVGNLQGQWRYRILKRVPAPYTLREMQAEGACD